MDLVRISTAWGRVAAIYNSRDPRNISRELLSQFVEAPYETLAKVKQVYNLPMDDYLEAALSDIDNPIPDKLNERAFWDGFQSERENL